MGTVNALGIVGQKCNFCGEAAVGIWFGSKGSADVFSCPICAVKVLPRLIADSLGKRNHLQLLLVEAEMRAEFWHGVAIRKEREAE